MEEIGTSSVCKPWFHPKIEDISFVPLLAFLIVVGQLKCQSSDQKIKLLLSMASLRHLPTTSSSKISVLIQLLLLQFLDVGLFVCYGLDKCFDTDIVVVFV